MADDTKVDIKDSISTPAPVADAVIETAVQPAKAVAKAVAKSNRRAVRTAAVAKAKRRIKAAAKSTPRKIETVARKSAAAAKEGSKTMKKTVFTQFDTVPAFAPFQTIFADASERGQDMAKKSQKVAEELADLTRANVEAIVEAGRVAAEGARAIGQDVVATGRDGAEKAADAIRSLAEAKSPTEYMQLQGDFARASFDRMVAEGSRLTESFVKLAGEAFQPLQSRASANAERFNTLVA
ncbi:MAG TPA: phasin family protein [Sphingomicrobium sp.]|nr:phasin family protein [Sphingomicrobium sp.]